MFSWFKGLFAQKPTAKALPAYGGPYRTPGQVDWRSEQQIDHITIIELRNKLDLILDMLRRPGAYGRERCGNSLRTDILDMLGEKSFGDVNKPDSFPPEPERFFYLDRSYTARHELRKERHEWAKARFNNPFIRWGTK